MMMEERVYIKQGDGSLRPLGLPAWLARRVFLYLALRNDHGLSPDEAQYLISAAAANLDDVPQPSPDR